LLDIVVVNRRAPLEIWQNDTKKTGHWAEIEPHMLINTRAIGAWIELRTEGSIQSSEVTIGGGHAGGKSGPVHFGLGTAPRAEVRIRWPNGILSDWTEIPTDQITKVWPNGKKLSFVP
jgi:hypothetical protein